jgi:hypothetical protein
MTDRPTRAEGLRLHSNTPFQQRFLFGENSPKWSQKKTIQIGEFLAIIEFESPILEPKKKKKTLLNIFYRQISPNFPESRQKHRIIIF